MFLLAMISLFVVVIAVPLAFISFDSITNKMSKALADLESSKKARDEALESLDPDMIKKSQDDYDAAIGGGIGASCTGCLLAIVALGGQLISSFGEIVVIVWALAANVGDPLYGYIALAIWLAMHAIAIFIGLAEVKVQNAAKEANVPYKAKKTPLALKLIGLLPDVYALYVFLVIIGVIAYQM